MRLIALSLALILPIAPAQSERIEFSINKPHTVFYFTVFRGGLTRMLGRFREVSGEFSIDPDDPGSAKVSTTIRTESIFTGFQRRDNHLRSPDFFNVKEFPEMTFTSTEVRRTGEKTAKLTGELTLLGVTKPVTFDVTFNRVGINRRSQKRQIGFSGVGKLNRSDFGMRYAQGFVGDEVTMYVEVLGDEK